MANGRANQIPLPQRLHKAPGIGEHGDGFQLSANRVSFIIEFCSIRLVKIFNHRARQEGNGWHLICSRLAGATIMQESSTTELTIHNRR